MSELSDGARSVRELQADLDRSQPSISNDLAMLRRLDLVLSDQVGNRSINRLNEEMRSKIKALLDVLFVS